MDFRCYLDENVTEHLVPALILLGFDVVSTSQLGRKGTSDALQLLVAAEHERVLITRNVKDFRAMHEAWVAWSRAWGATAVARHAGILIIEPGSGRAGGLSVALLASVVRELADTSGVRTNRLYSWNADQGLHETVL